MAVAPPRDVRQHTIKRLRKQYDGTERWVPIGTCVVNLTDGSGTVYLNHQDEIWQLFPRKDNT